MTDGMPMVRGEARGLEAHEIKHRKGRADKAWTTATVWHQLHEKVYRFTLPERGLVMTGTTNAPTFDDIWDSTARDANEDFASFISESLYPFDAPWLRYTPQEDIDREGEEFGQLVELAEHLTNVVRSLYASSNFYPTIYQANRDLAVGTRFVRIDIDPSAPGKLRFSWLPPYRWAIDEDGSGRITGLFQKLSLRAREIKARFEDQDGFEGFSHDLERIVENEPEREVTFGEHITRDPKSGAWSVFVFEDQYDHVVIDQKDAHKTPPVICTRWSRCAGTPWGVGPSTVCLPDTKVANRLAQDSLIQTGINAKGIWQGEDDGVLNFKAIDRLEAGMVFPIAPGSNGLRRLEGPGDMRMAWQEIERITQRIKAAHYSRRLPDREMTASEAMERVQQQQRQLRGTFGQLRAEDIEPIAERVLDLAEQMGAVRHEGLKNLMDLQLMGPLAMQMATMEADNVMQVHQYVSAMLGPQVAASIWKSEELIPWLTQGRGVPGSLVMDRDEIAQKMQEVKQMAQGVAQGVQEGEVDPQLAMQGAQMMGGGM